MDHLQRICWHEGMFLLPQHFQQWDRCRDEDERRRWFAGRPYAYGFTRLRVDEGALAAGTLSLLEAGGVLPDGTCFAAPDLSSPPPARPCADLLGPDRDRLRVFLGVTGPQYGRPAASADGAVDGRATRYRLRPCTVRDDLEGGEERELQVQELQLRLLFADDDRGGCSCLPLGTVARSAEGGLTLDRTDIPPCLTLAASDALADCLRRVVQLVAAREAEMAEQRRQRVAGHVEYSVSEITSVLTQQAVNGHLPVLLQYQREPTCHPFDLYQDLVRMIGQLCTFTSDRRSRDLPAYAHDGLGDTFGALEEAVRGLLGSSAPTRYVPLPLQTQKGGIHTTVLPEVVQADHRIFLSVGCGLPAERVGQEVPAKAKVTSTGRIGALMARSLRGLQLHFLSVPPSEIPVQPDRSYFELERQGEHWESILETASIAIYLPPEFSDLKAEFLAVRD